MPRFSEPMFPALKEFASGPQSTFSGGNDRDVVRRRSARQRAYTNSWWSAGLAGWFSYQWGSYSRPILHYDRRKVILELAAPRKARLLLQGGEQCFTSAFRS